MSFSIEAGKVTVLKGYGGRDAMRCILKLDEGRGSQVVRGGVTGDKLVKWFDRTKEEEWVALAGRSGNNNKNSSNNNNDPGET